MSFSDLARDLSTTERTLRRAAEAGTIRCRRISPRRAFVSSAERRYLQSHWPIVAELRRALRTEPNVACALLFGSFARGDDRADSDIDMLVRFRQETWRSAVGLERRLGQRLGRTVQVTSLPDAEQDPSLLADIVEDGRVLVDREGYAAALLRDRAKILAARVS